MSAKKGGNVKLMVELIIHPGAGKTGTTTIQDFLQKQYENLLNQRIGYLGMSFENTVDKIDPEEKYINLSSLKHRLGGRINKSPLELLEFCSTQIRLYLEKNPSVDILVWSNESLVNQHNWIRGLKKELEQLTRFKVIYGVRDPSNWIVSAYSQWGGNSDFKDFAIGRSLANPGKKWEEVSDAFKLLDIDSEANIIEAFSAMINYTPPKNFPASRANRTIDKSQFSKENSLRYFDLLTSDKNLCGWAERENSGIRHLKRLSR